MKPCKNSNSNTHKKSISNKIKKTGEENREKQRNFTAECIVTRENVMILLFFPFSFSLSTNRITNKKTEIR